MSAQSPLTWLYHLYLSILMIIFYVNRNILFSRNLYQLAKVSKCSKQLKFASTLSLGRKKTGLLMPNIVFGHFK